MYFCDVRGSPEGHNLKFIFQSGHYDDSQGLYSAQEMLDYNSWSLNLIEITITYKYSAHKCVDLHKSNYVNNNIKGS